MYRGKYYKDMSRAELIDALETLASIADYNFNEKSFEEGYAVAKRLYKPIGLHYVTESELEKYTNKKIIKLK